MERAELRSRISGFIEQGTNLNVLELKAFHRELEVINARAILDGTDDTLMKDVEFLLRSALFLRNLCQENDWKLQLQAAIGLLDSAPPST